MRFVNTEPELTFFKTRLGERVLCHNNIDNTVYYLYKSTFLANSASIQTKLLVYLLTSLHVTKRVTIF